MIKILVKLLVFLLFITNLSYAQNLVVFEFSEEELKSLEVRKVRGAKNRSEYSIGSNKNGNYLRAIADNAASGLGKQMKINLNSTPFINITWKVEKDLKDINEKSKKGHDFAARVFVIKKLVQLHYQIEQLIMFFPAITMLEITGLVLSQKNQLTMFYRLPKRILMNG